MDIGVGCVALNVRREARHMMRRESSPDLPFEPRLDIGTSIPDMASEPERGWSNRPVPPVGERLYRDLDERGEIVRS
jgi:hypothetical protein